MSRKDVYDELNKNLDLIINNIQKTWTELKNAIYAEYKKAGCPFGDSEAGMMAWLKARKEKAGLEYRGNCEKETKSLIMEINKKLSEKETHR